MGKLIIVDSDLIRSLYLSGISPNKIAKQIGSTRKIVENRLKTLGVYNSDIHLSKRYAIHKYKSKILDLYKQGYGSTYIDKTLNISGSLSYLKSLGLVRSSKEALDLSISKFKNIRLLKSKKSITLKNTDFFNVIDTEQKAYWLGFIYADGSISKNERFLRIDLAVKDKEHLDKFAKIFNSKVRYRSNLESVYTSIGSIYLVSKLIALDIKPNKTFFDSVVYKFIPDNLIRHFIRGFLDGDGSVKKKTIDFNGRNNILNFICDYFIQFLGVSKPLLSKHTNTSFDFYRISWTGYSAYKISQFLFSESRVYLKRKKLLVKKYLKGYSFRGVYKRLNYYESSIGFNNCCLFLGSYLSELDSAMAYDYAIRAFLDNTKYTLNLEPKTVIPDHIKIEVNNRFFKKYQLLPRFI